MFPLLPSTILQIQSSREQYASDNEEAHAQKHGRVVRGSGSKGSQIQSTNAIAEDTGDACPAGASHAPAVPLTGIKPQPSVKLAPKATA